MEIVRRGRSQCWAAGAQHETAEALYRGEAEARGSGRIVADEPDQIAHCTATGGEGNQRRAIAVA